jgi:hypothetical protein
MTFLAEANLNGLSRWVETPKRLASTATGKCRCARSKPDEAALTDQVRHDNVEVLDT